MTFDFAAVQSDCWDIRDLHSSLAAAAPFIRFWTSDPNPTLDENLGLVLQGVVTDSIQGNFPTLKNKPGTGSIRLRANHYVAQWLINLPTTSNPQNVVITVDTMGGANRWSGLMHHWQIVKDQSGVYYLDVTFIDDLQYIDFLLGAPNPALPIDIFQFPRVLPYFGPSCWGISVFLLIQLMRVESNWLQVPDDPFDLPDWWEDANPQNWQVLISCPPLLEDTSLWTILATRMAKMSTVIADALEDSQQVLVYRRCLTVDGETPADYGIDYVSTCKNGAVMLQVVDQSGFYTGSGTPTTGGIFGGFVRTIATWGDGFVENGSELVSDDEYIYPDEYYQPGAVTELAGYIFGTSWTVPATPWLVIRDSPWSQVQTGQLTYSPATACTVIVGGDNQYADQAINLAIEATGDILGYLLLGGFSSAGDIAASIIMPFIQGTVLAWIEWKNVSRTQNLGWAHLYETYQQGAESNVWSLAGIQALRAGFEATKALTTQQVQYGCGGPYYPGLQYSIGQRVGVTMEYLYGYILISQVEKITLAWDITADSQHTYETVIGEGKASKTAAERQAELVSKAMDLIANEGVHLLS
ncbi:Gp37-like protein [Tsukamurella soli]|uniref:Gp28/Gp37-like domain-containing protein n=1 Tax=Tsukamurella soli TaxID=644556 RepID=A0ABP8K2H5_9ACTN